MSSYQVGQIIYSKCGRDKSKPFIILDIKDNYLYLVDGDLRKLENPKKKKMKHVQLTKFVDENIKDIILNRKYLLDSDVRTAILKYNSIKL